jgi:Icc-related predicted phosphoesterase
MKIQVTSDLHLERASVSIRNAGADVLVLGGDVLAAKFLEDRVPADNSESKLFMRFRDFLSDTSSRFNRVVYVAGNHEHYGYKWKKTHDVLANFTGHYPNIHYLDRDYVDIDGMRFIGATLWTDMNKGDPNTLHAIRDIMNDYQHIIDDTLGYAKLKPQTTALTHKATLAKFKELMLGQEKVVVCTHHAPTALSGDPDYRDEYIMNGAYYSDLGDFILDHPQIKLWTHGHMHTPVDYVVGGTRVVSNPRGYVGYETRAWKWDGGECVVEI